MKDFYFQNFHMYSKFILSCKCMFLGSLSHHNKDLEQRTLKPSAHHSSRVLDKLCYSSQANQCYSSILFRRQQENPRLKEKRVEERAGEVGRERERERAHTGGRETESTRKCFGSSFYMLFPPPGPALCIIGLSQECCLFCLKFSLWSSDLPLTFLVFQPLPFWTPFPYSTYLTQVLDELVKIEVIR